MIFKTKYNTFRQNILLTHWKIRNPRCLYRKILHQILRELFAFFYYRRRLNHSNLQLTSRAASLIPELKKPGLLLTAHFGNYELIGPWLYSLGVPILATWLPLKNPLANKLLQKLRDPAQQYTALFPKGLTQIQQAILQGHRFTLVADQDWRSSAKHRKPQYSFLGKKVHCNPIPNMLILKNPQISIHMAWVIRKNRSLILDVCPLSSDSAMVYEQYHHHLENLIHTYPEQWYGWIHRRFKSTYPHNY